MLGSHGKGLSVALFAVVEEIALIAFDDGLGDLRRPGETPFLTPIKEVAKVDPPIVQGAL